MGIEAFIYPFLIIVVFGASIILSKIVLQLFKIRNKIIFFGSISLAAPIMVMLMAFSDPAMDWAYVRFSMGLAAIASCLVALFFVLFRFPK
ncbi:MAG: hypothetical protein ABIM50_03790 [Novosphingobium sp.]